MKNISLRLPDKLLEEIDNLVEQGIYANRTEALRDAARQMLRQQIGSIPGKPPKIDKNELWEEFTKGHADQKP